MFSRKADAPLVVQVPRPGEDQPRWRQVGVITAIGFIVGVAWPRLMGVRVGPSVHESTGAAVASAAAPADTAAPVPVAPASAPPSATAPAAAVVPAPSASEPSSVSVTVGHGIVYTCKTADGDTEKGPDCGALPGADGLIMPRLRKLSECPDAVDANGKVHFVVHLDFGRGGVGIDLGRGHGVTSPDKILACARTDIVGVPLAGVPHENPRYSVAYTVTFAPGSPASAATTSSAASASARVAGDESSAQIVWEVAIVRDAPKTGKVIARLQRGSELHLGAPKDGWYPIKFGDGFGTDGWIYRGAIGR